MSYVGHNAYQTSAIETASPEQLTLLCYDGALKFMRRAKTACENKDIAKLSEFTGRAQAIINELNITLNMEDGGEVASNLRQLYLFVNRHLGHATMKQDPKALEDCMKIVTNLRDAWAQAMNLESKAA